MGPRQHQYAGQNVADGHTGTGMVHGADAELGMMPVDSRDLTQPMPNGPMKNPGGQDA
jgi:hypothetical protein